MMRLGERQVDQPDIHEIPRHLVGDPQGAGGPAPEPLGIAPAEITQPVRRKGRYAFRVFDRVGRAGSQLLDEAAEVGKFARAIYQRVACQNLLDKGSAGTRHADDEDRDRGGISGARLRIDQTATEGGADPLERIVHAGFIISDLPALQLVPVRQVPEPLVISAKIVIDLGQREMQLDLRDGGEPVDLPRQPLHRR